MTLARSLKNSGIKTVIFEKNPSPAKHAYGITLQPWACLALLRILNIDESTFYQRVAVDSVNGGRGYVYEKFPISPRTHSLPSPLRAHCGRLEGLLRENLDIKFGHALEDVTRNGTGKTTLSFKDQETIESEFTVDTCGVHSQIRRCLLPEQQLNILPYVVFRGTRRLQRHEFTHTYEPHFKAANIITCKTKNILLQIQINDYKKDPSIVDISYVYSRPARTDDKLHRPERKLRDSVNVSEAFFTEIAELEDLEPPFQACFIVEKMREERILHWLMRNIVIPSDQLSELAQEGIVLIGDSAHAMPIIGGEGANFAIIDAAEMAEAIMERGKLGMGGFFQEKDNVWQQAVKKGEERLRDMHAPLLFLKLSSSAL